jgi:hypothetical protein
MFVRDALAFVVFLAAMVTQNVLEGGWLDTVCMLAVAVAVGQGALGGTRRAMSYMGGYVNGRCAMIRSLDEAQRRGMTLEEWLRGELARDMALFGSNGGPDDRGA